MFSVTGPIVGERTILAVIFHDRKAMGLIRVYASKVSAKLSKHFNEIANGRFKDPDPFDGTGPTPLPA